MVTVMKDNLFVSFEQALTPVGEPSAPKVGLLVSDFDANLGAAVSQLTDAGRTVELIPLVDGVRPAMEDDLYKGDYTGNGQPAAMEEGAHVEPQTLFYYKGKPEDANEGIPVLMVMDGKVQVSHEGRVKELAEALGMLDDDDRQHDHEYRD